MTITRTSHTPLRLTPAVVIAVVQLLVMLASPIVSPDGAIVGLLGGVIGAALILIWWLFFSRAPWLERFGAIAFMVVAVLATRAMAHISIVGAGQGMLMYILPAPYLALALVVAAALARRFPVGVRRASIAVAVLVACAPFALIRTAGIIGGAMGEFHWRWTPTPEQLLLAQVHDEPTAPPTSPPAPAAVAAAESPKETPATKPIATPEAGEKSAGPAMSEALSSEGGESRVEWPGFRGPNRDGVIHGVRIKTDWSTFPPVQLWRRPIGPGWSSFAVHGDFLFTQEQRGADEVVSCYRLSTGEPVWRHRDAVRFYESNGGAGPRGTPTLSGSRVYTSGATGILNALDARTGAVLWSHHVAEETKTPSPMWGFSSSPLVLDGLVIVAASGTLAAYDATTGRPRWANESRGGSYSSPHRATLDGVEQVLLLGGPAVMSVAPADGTLLWEHKWEGGAIVQPAITADGGVLINAMTATGGMGTRRLAVTRGPGGWTVEERWTSNGLKPYYNDFVVHKGHAFGFDNNILSCIDLEDGKRVWKGGRYGNGQMVLLADEDLLLVSSEEGDVALVSATPDKFIEIARFQALDAKTWNHPVLVGNILLVRNGEEMAAFRLQRQEAGTP